MLREFIRFALIERIRSMSKFNLNEFKILNSIDDCVLYAKKRLKFINSGSSRFAFILSAHKCLKIAKNFEYGIEQNKREIKHSTIPGLKNFFTKIYDHDQHDGKWIIAELVKPVKSIDVVSDYFGIKPKMLGSLLLEINQSLRSPKTYHVNVDDEYFQFRFVANKNKIEQFIKMIKLCIDNDVETFDMSGVNQWGQTADGRIVLLDYGI